MSNSWYENEDHRKLSIESEDQGALALGIRKISKKRSRILSVDNGSPFGSVASNLNRTSQGPLEVNKIFLTDDYFSDVNPRSMRRLMNVIYVMGRLLKAFSIDFNWNHLASWANITEQWPYHTSWIILFVENYSEKFDDSMSLKHVYDMVNQFIPTQKEIEPLIEYDRDRKKLDVFLSLHKKTLTVADIKVYIPFTINLDPYLRKVIKEEVQNMEEMGVSISSGLNPVNDDLKKKSSSQLQTKPLMTRRQAAELSKKMSDYGVVHQNVVNPLHYHKQFNHSLHQPTNDNNHRSESEPELKMKRPILPKELQGLVLSSMNLEQVCLMIKTIDGVNSFMVDTYCSSIVSNNITGQVLLHCDVNELKSVLNMNFGDWELFKLVLNGMREDEHHPRHHQNKKETPEPSHSSEKAWVNRKQSNIEKQVAMEEAAVSGLLSTLNEDAKEDILLEELDNAREAASNISQFPAEYQRQISTDAEESDVLYYSNLNNQPSTSRTQSRDEAGSFDMEAGKMRSSEMVWSAASSRHGSMIELDALVSGSSPGTSRRTLSRDDTTRKSLSRTNTSVSFLTPTQGGDSNSYSWLSAPPSPRDDHFRLKYFSDSNAFERESDSNSKKGILSSRSVRRTKKKQVSGDNTAEESDDNTSGLSRTSSRMKIDKMKRKLRNALTSNEPGQLPMVQKAKPNAEEYLELNKSQRNSRSSSVSESVCLSDESLSSPEQQTIARRPDHQEQARPTLQSLFPEQETSRVTATLPDGSNVTSSQNYSSEGDQSGQQ